MGLLSITIDLDEIDCYASIHGIDSAPKSAATAIYSRALPRIARFIEDLGIPVTLFVVGKDIQNESTGVSILSDMVAMGHELGNHTMNHRYDLISLPRTTQRSEIDEAGAAIKERFAHSPVGFRSPGYNPSDSLVDLLVERGYLYDSSVFPCPIYYSAKAVAIAVKAMKGTQSASRLGDPRIQSAPPLPYRIGKGGVWTKGKGLSELPITVVTRARIPFIGTSLALMGAVPAAFLSRLAAKQSFVNLEFHGIDFTDMDGDGLSFLRNHQPDLRIPWIKKREIFKSSIEILLEARLDPVTLHEASTRLRV